MSKYSRRDFLKLTTDGLLVLGGVLGLGGLFRFLSYEKDPAPPSEYDLGPAINYLPDTTTVLAHIPAALVCKGHNDYQAFSLVCTHLGCTVEQLNDTYECPCHGSVYDSEGQLRKGPAQKSLRSLKVTKNGEGNLILHMT
jgi:cytochrome b6-f complex iron-sulfur subunit